MIDLLTFLDSILLPTDKPRNHQAIDFRGRPPISSLIV